MIKFLPDIIITISIATYVFIYIRGIRNGQVKPTLSTWIFFVFAVILSVITDFRETGVPGLFANSYNILDMIGTFCILGFILFQKNTKKGFNRLEKWCLVAVGIIFIFWLLSGQNVLAHLATQLIMFIAYIPMVWHLWNAKENHESLSMWSIDSFASFVGCINPILHFDLLPLVYGLRSAFCTFATVILIIRLKYKIKNEKLS